MTDDILIRAEGVSKKYCKSIKHTMLYGVSDLSSSFLGLQGKNEELRAGEFWAVKDVNFELRRGECLGLIGPNGAGKSTLLKLLNGIFMPDKGKIEINGKVGALIEVGAGFHPMLTGRENIYVNGSILGMTKEEIDRKFDAIVDFAEIEEFIDSPVKHYSSGMHVRLGFAIAAQMEPDILLIDEVLAVGDIGFRSRCYNAISKIQRNAAIIFISHDMPTISRTCSTVGVLNRGEMIYSGDVSKSIETYFSLFKGEKSIVSGNGKATIHKSSFYSNGKEIKEEVSFGDDLEIHLEFSVDSDVSCPEINIGFLRIDLQGVAQCNSINNKIKIENHFNGLNCILRIPRLLLSPGIYYISIIIFDHIKRENLVWHYASKRIQVVGDFIGAAPVQFLADWKFVD